MRIILFDIDGTLTDTTDADTSCFVQAVTDILGISDIDTDWSRYVNVTDTGILSHLVQERMGRLPTLQEIVDVRERFHRYLVGAFSHNPALCRPIKGGPDFLRALVDEPNNVVGYATGGWEITARLKLERAGYEHAALSFASSDDAQTRTEICSIAATRALCDENNDEVKRTVYFGDGIWDLRAAAALGFEFVGVAQGRRADVLRQAGATVVIPNFNSPELLEFCRSL